MGGAKIPLPPATFSQLGPHNQANAIDELSRAQVTSTPATDQKRKEKKSVKSHGKLYLTQDYLTPTNRGPTIYPPLSHTN